MAKKNKVLLDNLVKGAIERLEKIENFTLEQAPDVAKQVVEEAVLQQKQRLTMAIVGIVTSLILVAVCYFSMMKGNASNDGVGWYTLSVLTGIITFALGGCSIETLSEAYWKMQIIKATPKLMILRELKGMIRD